MAGRAGGQTRVAGEAVEGLLAALPVGVACLDGDLRVVWANAVFVAATAVEPGMHLRSADGPLPAVAAAARAALESGARAEVGVGERSVAQVFRIDGARVGVMVVEAVDRVAVEASERRFEAFIDHSPAISFMTDEADGAVYLSRSYLETFGLGAEMVGRPAWELLPAEFVERYLECIRRVRETGEMVRACVPSPGKDGVRYWDTQYFPIQESPRRLVGGVSFEVTELVRAREELRDRADEQAALRRVATLVTREAPEDGLFRVVCEEVGRLLGADAAALLRFTGDGRAVVVGVWSEAGVGQLPVGMVLEIDPHGILATIRDTRAPALLEEYAHARGTFAALVRASGLRSSVAAPVVLADQLWGAVVASTTNAETLASSSEQRLAQFAELVSQALANSDAHRELRASRVRIVEAGDAERRRLGRDLHDGAQQRIVSLLLELQLVREHAETQPEPLRELLDHALETAQAAVDELRDLAAGIHPAILTQRGLDAALESLTSRAPLPIERHVALAKRLPLALETAAYYVVAEALTNVAKYAQATHAQVTVRREDDDVVVEIRDDGVGGADPERGSGLHGLADRVGALDGTLELHSPPGAGTTVVARISVRD